MRLVLSLTLLLILGSCGAAPRSSSGDILMIGDSVLAWNRFSGQDAGRQLEARLDRDVVNRAALGARLSGGRLGGVTGLSIPGQLSGGRWNWVVMNGGANDLAASCGCGACEAELDALIAPDGAGGVIPGLIARARATGAQVVWAGYYQAPASRSFAGCRPTLVRMEQRIAALAEITEGVFFVDIEEVLDPAVPGVLASDLTHPSPAGSGLIAGLLARTIAAEERR